MRVSILSSEDGRQSIVKGTREMSRLALSGQIKSSTIDTEFVDNYFQGEFTVTIMIFFSKTVIHLLFTINKTQLFGLLTLDINTVLCLIGT